MKTIEDAKRILRLCNATETDWGKKYGLWMGYACEICGGCCHECSTDITLRWVWPELKGFNGVATEDEWKASSGYERWAEIYDEGETP